MAALRAGVQIDRVRHDCRKEDGTKTVRSLGIAMLTGLDYIVAAEAAAGVNAPEGPVILTVAGAISNANRPAYDARAERRVVVPVLPDRSALVRDHWRR